jgi:uncharacterized protein YeaO (DUF488 family)
MRSPEAQSEIRRLARQAATRPLTVMCVCKDATRCHRTLLTELIGKAMSGAVP